jgi:hypothetical protein
MAAPERACSYEIRVLGALDAHWSAWFAGLEVASDASGETTLTGPLRDQSELHGILARIRDLGLPLVGIRRLDDPTCRERPHPDQSGTTAPSRTPGTTPGVRDD